MIRILMHYPGDPSTPVVLMFGAEFLAQRGPGFIQVGDLPRIEFDEAICDQCNSEVQPLDPCAVALDRLYCWGCWQQWLKPHCPDA